MGTGARPRLLFVAPYFPPAQYGGVVQVYLQLLQGLDGFAVEVVADRSGGAGLDGLGMERMRSYDADARERGLGISRIGAFELHFQQGSGGNPLLSRVGQTAEFFRDGWREWDAVVRAARPELVVCGGTYSAGWLMGRLPKGTRLVNYLHGEELTMRVSPRWLMPWMRRRQMQAIRRAALNIAVSGYTAELAVRLSGAQPERMVVLPNFVDTTRFRVTGRRDELRAKRGWTGELVILSLARLEPRKGLDQALRAVAEVCRSGQMPGAWRYVIAGRGGELRSLRRLAQELGLEDRVSFYGFVPEAEVAEMYEAADIYLQPNREIDGDTEGFGIVFLEASACGVPVIGGIAGGTADAIAEGLSGLRVDGERVDAIAAAMARLAGDAELRRRMGEQGALRVVREFGLVAARARFVALLERVMASE